MTAGVETRAHPRAALGLERARLAISMGKWLTARALLEDLLEERPGDVEAQSLHALSLVRTGGDLEKARESCQRAIDAEPFAARHRARLAQVYAALGLERRAAACMAEAQRLDPAPDDAADAPLPTAPRSRSWLHRRLQRASRPHTA